MNYHRIQLVSDGLLTQEHLTQAKDQLEGQVPVLEVREDPEKCDVLGNRAEAEGWAGSPTELPVGTWDLP